MYSFCMCPGGYVIPTTTELEHVNVNGMSNAKRGSEWANSALVVTVEPSDFWIDAPGDLDHEGPLAGIAFQRHLESAAYRHGGGGYVAPAQRLTDFIHDPDAITAIIAAVRLARARQEMASTPPRGPPDRTD